MLSLLKIKNIALIDELSIEFGEGLNLLTGETGSGKSIIVDSLGALTGERVSGDLIKEGREKALIEGLFLVGADDEITAVLDSAGIEFEADKEIELIVRRELASNGRNRVFINNQLVTQGLLKDLGSRLADIHGQGEQTTLFNPACHIEILDGFAKIDVSEVQDLFAEMQEIKRELNTLREDDAQKLQLVDILRFQTDEIKRANLQAGEDEQLEDEKKRLNNVEKLSTLSDEAYRLLYEDNDAIIAKLGRVSKLVEELSDYESGFGEYPESIESAHAVLEDLAIFVRDFKNSIEFSPSRLEEIENRLSEIAGLKRKYGGTLATVLAHYAESKERLDNIETAGEKENQLRSDLQEKKREYVAASSLLSARRKKSAREFEKRVGEQFVSVALEKARFEVKFEQRSEESFAANGIDEVEFYFSANPGESPKPLAKVASGGESSRLMLILKTASGLSADGKAVVFDEVDAGIGGRVAEAVGLKLKALAGSQQILCVTHHPQVASLADRHYLVEKTDDGKKTLVAVRELDENEKLEEVARMLAGEKITAEARENARSMLKAKA